MSVEIDFKLTFLPLSASPNTVMLSLSLETILRELSLPSWVTRVSVGLDNEEGGKVKRER